MIRITSYSEDRIVINTDSREEQHKVIIMLCAMMNKCNGWGIFTSDPNGEHKNCVVLKKVSTDYIKIMRKLEKHGIYTTEVGE